MIDHMQVTINKINEATVIACVGPICFELAVAHPGAFVINQSVCVYTHLHWNQETGGQLFGFQSIAQRTVFLLVISCSGIGPKIALALLAHLSLSEFIQAIALADAHVLSRVPGIGLKKAEQIIVHLKHKIETLRAIAHDSDDAGYIDVHRELSQVLASLHYSRSEINEALAHLAHKQGESFDQLLRASLSFLAKKI